MPNPTIKYVAEITNVCEVSLWGTAGLAFWTERLRPYGLAPAVKDGKARLLVSAIAARYMGVRFRELTFSIAVSGPADESPQERFFLAHAFHSSRLFALIERTCFSTPYHFANLHVAAGPPAIVRMIGRDAVLFEAALSADDPSVSQEPSRFSNEHWEGPIYLPQRGGALTGSGKVFYAKLSGRTETRPFVPGRDRLTIEPRADQPILQWLLDSAFAGEEWLLRPQAAHARSKTFRRSGFPA